MNRTSTYLATLVGVICAYFLIHEFAFPHPRILRNDVIQGILIGGGLALYIFTRRRKLNFGTWADIAAPGLALAQAEHGDPAVDLRGLDPRVDLGRNKRQPEADERALDQVTTHSSCLGKED